MRSRAVSSSRAVTASWAKVSCNAEPEACPAANNIDATAVSDTG